MLDIKQSTFSNLDVSGTDAIKLASNTTALIQMCNFNDIVSSNTSDVGYGAGIFVTQSTNVKAHGNGGCIWQMEKTTMFTNCVSFDTCVSSGNGRVFMHLITVKLIEQHLQAM